MRHPSPALPDAARPPGVGALAVVAIGIVALAVAMGFGRFAFTPLLPLMLRDGSITAAAGAEWAAANHAGYLVGALTAGRQRRQPRRGLLLALAGIVLGKLARRGAARRLDLRRRGHRHHLGRCAGMVGRAAGRHGAAAADGAACRARRGRRGVGAHGRCSAWRRPDRWRPRRAGSRPGRAGAFGLRRRRRWQSAPHCRSSTWRTPRSASSPPRRCSSAARSWSPRWPGGCWCACSRRRSSTIAPLWPRRWLWRGPSFPAERGPA